MKDLIYCQRDIPAEKWRYGLRTSAATGCGWIATYNALRLMGYYAEPEKLIRMYERMLPIVHGNAGTSIPAPALAFRNWGFPVKMLANSARFDEAAREADVSILFYYWRNKWKFGSHFVTLQAKEDGFVGYNTYRNSKGPDNWGNSIPEFMKKHHYFAPVLICIRDKR
jgi:hypothetical protein